MTVPITTAAGKADNTASTVADDLLSEQIRLLYRNTTLAYV